MLEAIDIIKEKLLKCLEETQKNDLRKDKAYCEICRFVTGDGGFQTFLDNVVSIGSLMEVSKCHIAS